jgi:hypothetical protein
MILRRADPLFRPLEEVGPPWKSNFFGPKWQSLAFQGPKKPRFPVPTPSKMALVIDMPASKSLRTVPYKQQVH